MLTWGITEEANCWVRADEQGTFQVETGPLLSGTVAVLLSAQPLVRLHEEAHLEEAR